MRSPMIAALVKPWLLLLGSALVIAQTQQSAPIKSVVEYPLPAAAQTHEIIAASDRLLLITQQTDGSLVKVALDEHGNPTGSRKYTLTNQWSGLHGLALQTGLANNSNAVWATTQFDNTIIQINPNGEDINAEPTVVRTIPVPSPAYGPHGVLVHDGNLWLACKDSSHVVRINIENPSDSQIWAVSRRPIFVAVHPKSGDVYSGLDTSSKIWHYKNDGGNGTEIEIPKDKGSTPVGLVSGTDGNVWFVLGGNTTTGTGTFGRINENADITWFTLPAPFGQTASLLHLAFDPTDPERIWLLGTSLICPSCLDAVFTVKLSSPNTLGTAQQPTIYIQNTVVLPTQRSWTHRIINHQGQLFITELAVSTLAHVQGSAVNGTHISETWDEYVQTGQGVRGGVVNYQALT